MNIEELEEALKELLPSGFTVNTNSHGQIVVYTGLKYDDDDEEGDLIAFDEDEVDMDADTDFESLDDEEEDDEE